METTPLLELPLPDLGRLVQRFWYALPMGIVGFLSWSVWGLRWWVSRRYRPVVNEHRASTSVVVPVYREDPDVLIRCLESWLEEEPDEIILVVDVGDEGSLARLARHPDERVRVIPFRHAGKRSALGVGIRAARNEVVVLADSDTCWERGLLTSVQMPFADPAVGGVGTRQNAHGRASSVWRLVADWLVNTRYLDYVPAMGMAGGVACLSGRTAAYRRAAILPLLRELENEYFLGRRCDAGDDGRLTWLVLGSGYKTVYQASARARSMFPCTFRAFVKQRVRWSRNSYRCYLTAVHRGWLWHQPLMTQITVFQILLTPLSMLCAVSVTGMALLHQHWDLLAIGCAGMLAGRAVRSVSHLREHPSDLVYLPLVTVVVILIALPIKAWGALTMNRHGWLTRSKDGVAAEAQSEASLQRRATPEAAVAPEPSEGVPDAAAPGPAHSSVISSLLLALALALLPSASHARTPASATDALLRGESVRVGRMLRLERRGAPAPASIVSSRVSPPAPRAGGRLIYVATAEGLTAALDAVQPGDVIRMADGVYGGNFVARIAGKPGAPITLWGSRAAILDGGTIATGYGFHLRADHWILSGFSVRNARKGIMTDGASHSLLEGLEVSRIGEEGIHFRSFSSDNLLERSWIHDVGRLTPVFGEGVYIGSALSNWGEKSGGAPDRSDRNRVVGNVIGPGVPAECIDAKEGSSGGEIRNNLFLATGSKARAWVDLKANGYRVEGNDGTYRPGHGFESAARVVRTAPGWGLDNVMQGNTARVERADAREPFRASNGEGAATIVLPRRALPYSVGELRVRFPESLARVEPDVLLLHDHLLASPGVTLTMTPADVHELRLLSHGASFVSVVGVGATISIAGTGRHRVRIQSWDPVAGRSDRVHGDGRSYLLAMGGRMDLEYVDATDLGFGTGRTSGVAWRGEPGRKARGSVRQSRFERNYYGAYTFEAEEMRWVGNVFAHNVAYGFDPHDHSDGFLFEDNVAYGNGLHGIIFSRGCRGNVLRRNQSYANQGNGIMIDDGRVANDGDPRHAHALPSDDNLMEENELWDNEIGVALDGGSGNVVRANRIHRNAYGVRLEGRASGNRIADNEILASRAFAIHIYDRSDRNRVVDNRIEGGRGGIVVKNSVANVIERNTLSGIEGRGIVLSGRVTDSGVSDNRIQGRGSRAVDVALASGVEKHDVSGNRTLRWLPARGFPIGIAIWAIVLLAPFAVGLPMRWALRARARRGRPAAGLGPISMLGIGFAGAAAMAPAPAVAAGGQSLAVTMGIASYFDDNILRYSADQIRDLDSGLHSYRFSVSEPGDLVFHPSLALTWHSDPAGGKRRWVRASADGEFHRTNGVANVGELGVAWQETFARHRRLTLSYSHVPNSYQRRLYDADLAPLPSTERYRDASVDLQSGAVAWRQAAPRVTWAELGYRYDRTRYAPEFRERDSDTHRAGIVLGFEAVPREARLQLGARYVLRDARAEDGAGPEASLGEPDLGFHGIEVIAGGSMDLGRTPTAIYTGDVRYELEVRRFDSSRPADESHFGRNDRAHTIEIGLAARTGPRWLTRAFYRYGRNLARYGATAPPGSEVGGYRGSQAGVELQWTGGLWRRDVSAPAAEATR